MKTFLIGLFVISFINLGYSQVTDDKKEVALKSVTVTTLNKNYLDRVQDLTMSIYVKELENSVSNYDITRVPGFDGRDKPFKAVFKSQKGNIVATFDSKGKILTTLEKFKNVKLPDPVLALVFKDNPNWGMLSDSYLVVYNCDKPVKKIYKVQIVKGDLKKRIRIDFNGDRLVVANSEKLIFDAIVSQVSIEE